MKIAVGADHAGFRYKEEIKKSLKKNGHEVVDFGTHSEQPVDYPLFIRPVAEAVARKEVDRGIVLGGSGNGEAIVANRVAGIRCALCWNQETALLARKHNDANALSLGARMISLEEALQIVEVWLATPFEGGRHLRRIQMIDQREEGTSPASTSKKKGKELPQAAGGSEALKTKGRKPGEEAFDLLIAFRYIKYMEGDMNLEFKVDPGLKRPSVIYIPSPQRWNRDVPPWARDRREEILSRIRSKTLHLNLEWKEDPDAS